VVKEPTTARDGGSSFEVVGEATCTGTVIVPL
jgi:hypothetical protein